MKIKWWLCILWRVFSLNIAISTSDIYGSTFVSRPVGRRKILKLGTSQGVGDSLTAHLSSTANRKSSPTILSHSISFRTSQLTHEPKPALARTHSSPPPQIQRLMLLDRPIPKSQRDFGALPDVSVTCSSGDFVVRVKRDFYGFDADADELILGSTCKSNGVLMPYGDLLFSYPLMECDGKREMPPGYLIYKFVLHYTPLTRFPRRAHRINVEVECRFQRYHHVYQLAVRPTWETPTVLKRLKGRTDNFRIQLMGDAWAMPAKYQVYMLGQTINFQVSALHLPHGGKLFINHCYATTSKLSKTALKFTVIDNFGCMLESQKNPGGSQFVSPRTDDTLRFFLSAFQFTSDPDTPVFLHCKLHVTSEETGPMHKSCTYHENRWKAVMGEDSICDCCDSKCVTPKPRRAMVEGFANSGPLLLLDQPSAPKGGFPPVSPSLVDEDVVWFETRMDEFDNPDDLLETFDMEKYRDKEEQSYTHSKEKQHIEEDEAVPLEGEESEVVQTVFRKGKIFERTQGSGVRDSELKRGEGAELRERSPWEREGSVLTEEGSIERQWMHPQEESSSLGSGMGEKSVSQEEGVSQSMKEWGFRVGEEQPLEIPEDEGKEGREESGGTDEDDKFPLFSEAGEEVILCDYDGLVESGIDCGKNLPSVWHFKWQ